MLNGITGLGPAADYYVMNSSEKTDKVIALFESAIAQGYCPELVEQEIYKQAKVNPADFTYADKERISRRVNEVWASKNNTRRNF